MSNADALRWITYNNNNCKLGVSRCCPCESIVDLTGLVLTLSLTCPGIDELDRKVLAAEGTDFTERC